MIVRVGETLLDRWIWCPACDRPHGIPRARTILVENDDHETARGHHGWTWNGDMWSPRFWPSVRIFAGDVVGTSLKRDRGPALCHFFVGWTRELDGGLLRAAASIFFWEDSTGHNCRGLQLLPRWPERRCDLCESFVASCRVRASGDVLCDHCARDEGAGS